MRLNDVDMLLLKIFRDFRRTGNGIMARQRLGALHTNLLNMGFVDDARTVRRVLRGLR